MKSTYTPTRSLVALALLLVALLVATGSGQAARAGSPASPFADGPPPVLDADGNGLFEDLEARLAEISDSSKVDVLVKLNASATSSRVGDLASRLGGFTIGKRFGLVDGFSARVTKAQAEALARMPTVEDVELDGEVHALNDSAQASFGVTKARIDDPALDGDGDGNPDVYSPADLVAAVIDTGIDASHVDLDGGKVLAWKDFVNGRTTPYDDNGHGSHVSGTIAGTGDGRPDHLYKGVAPAAGLIGLKVLNSAGSGSFSNVISALDWIVANKATYGIEAANLSLGADGCNNGTDLTSQAIQRAVDAGIVVAVAAGNAGPGACTVGTPGAAPAALTVGAAVDLEQGGFYLASFSSRGPTLDGRIKPDVVAPGYRITSVAANTGNGYAIYSGTSMATPFVCGVSLLMRDASPSLTPQQIKSAITSTAEDWGPSGPDGDYGAGRLDAYAALRAVGAPLGTTGPAVPTHTFSSGSLSGTNASTDIALNITDTQFPIAATMIESGVTSSSTSSPNFDLALLSPTGATVASASTSNRQDTLTYRPTATGTYTLRIRSAFGSGPYVVDISAGTGATAPPPPPPAPATAPAAPSLDSASAGPGVVSLSWTPGSNGGSAITGYRLYRGTASGGETLLGSVGTSASFNDTLVSPGTAYYYKVTAVNSVGEGLLSNERSATTPSAPGAPGLTATAGNGAVTLSWSAPSDGGSAITGYRVYRGGASGGETLLTTTGTGSGYTDSGLSNGSTYYYTVSAVNAVGEGAQSTERSATPAAPADTTAPSKPTGMNNLVQGTNQLAIDWTGSTDNVGVAGYEVYRNNVLAGTVTTTYFLDSGLAANTVYTYTVRAVDAAGNRSSASSSLSPRTASQGIGTKGTLAGVVFDPSGVGDRYAVATFKPSSGTTKTDSANSKGVWSISNLNAGGGTLTITAPGQPTQTYTVSVVAGKTVLTYAYET